MKKALSILFLLLGSSLFFARPVDAATNICNASCQVNEDCGQGYRCYVGVCRNEQCPSSPACGCTSATAVPTATPKQTVTVTTTPTPTATASAKIKVATVSAKLQKTPTTGPKEDLIGIAFLLFAAGMALYVREYSQQRSQ